MRRRKIREGNLWLRNWDDEPDSGTTFTDRFIEMSVSECVHTLTHRHRLCVEFEQAGDTYMLRCYPRQTHGSIGGWQTACAYSGISLTSISNAAVKDYARIESGSFIGTYQKREHLRWVAS